MISPIHYSEKVNNELLRYQRKIIDKIFCYNYKPSKNYCDSLFHWVIKKFKNKFIDLIIHALYGATILLQFQLL